MPTQSLSHSHSSSATPAVTKEAVSSRGNNNIDDENVNFTSKKKPGKYGDNTDINISSSVDILVNGSDKRQYAKIHSTKIVAEA